MDAIGISLIVFACVAGGALFGMFLASVLPPQHLTNEAKDTVKLGMGLIGTMTAILLGLLIASAKTFFDTQSTELTKLSSNVILLDRILAHCGPDAKDARDVLRSAVGRVLDTMWPQEHAGNSQAAAPGGGEVLYEKIQALTPQNDSQRSLQSQALNEALDLGKTRWLMFEQASNSVSTTLLVVLVLWLSLIFCSFGLLAPRNPLVVVTLCLCALCVSAAIFLMIEMYSPYQGLVQVSSAPLRAALVHLGK